MAACIKDDVCVKDNTFAKNDDVYIPKWAKGPKAKDNVYVYAGIHKKKFEGDGIDPNNGRIYYTNITIGYILQL
jgi:uncharacterized protein (DUF2147 family)